MALTDLTRISTSGIATGTSLSGAILHGDAHFRGTQVGVTSALFDSSDDALEFNDNVKLKFGNSGDLSLFHNASDSVISHSAAGEGSLKILSGGAQSIECIKAGAVELAHNGNKKLETDQAGVKITGILTATSFSGPTNNTSGIATFYDLRVSNNLTVEGSTSTLDTTLIGVDRVEVGANSNTIAGIAVTQSGTADLVRLYDGASQVVTVDDEGKVGIGVAAPNAIIEASSNNAGSGYYLKNTNTTSGFGLRVEGGGTTADRYSLAVFNAAGSEKFRVNANGNVGIGSAIPSEKLDVIGTSRFQGEVQILSGNQIKLLNDANTANVTVDCDGGARFHVKSYSQSVIQAQENWGVKFFQGTSTERFTIEPTGGVVVGAGGTIKIPDKMMHVGDEDTYIRFPSANQFDIWTNGNRRLNVNSGGGFTFNHTTVGTSYNFQGPSNDNNWGGFIKLNSNNNSTVVSNIHASTSGMWFTHGGDYEYRLYLKSDGNVGIGTDNPLTELHIHGETFTDMTIHSERTSGNVGGLNFRKGGVTSGIMTAQYLVDVSGNHYFHSQGSQRLKISSDGDLLITGSDNAELKLKCGTSTGNNVIAFLNSSGTTKGNIFYDSDNNFMVFKTDGTASSNERLRITSGGDLIVGGHTSVVEPGGYASHLEILGTATDAGASIVRYSDNAGGPTLVFGKSRNATIGSITKVQENDNLGKIQFYGTDTDWEPGAAIQAFADGEWRSGSVGAEDNTDSPGRLEFHTTPNGSDDLQERLRITSDGYIHAGNTGHGTNKVGGQAITGQDYDPYLKILANTSNHWLMQARSDVTSGNGIFLRSGNSSSTYTLYATGYDENNPHLIVRGDGKVGIGEDDPESNHLLIRGASTVATKSGHIMLTGDSATVGEGPQIVFAESGATTSYAGGYVGFLRQGSNSIGDLVFGTRGTSGDANTVPTERLRISKDGNILINNRGNAMPGLSGNADDLVIGYGTESNETGITMYSTSTSGIRFNDNSGTDGAIEYTHSARELRFNSAGANRLQFGINASNSPVFSLGTGHYSGDGNNHNKGDRVSVKVGAYLHLESATGAGHNTRAGIGYNCYFHSLEDFYCGTKSPSSGDNRPAAYGMAYGNHYFYSDTSNTAHSAQAQLTMSKLMEINRNGKIKYGPSLVHQLHSQQFLMYPNNGSNNTTRLTFTGLISGTYIAQIGYYNAAGQGYGGASFHVSGYQTATYTYNVHEIVRWDNAGNSSISAVTKSGSNWYVDITNTHASYTGGGEVSVHGDAQVTCTITYI